MANDSMRAIIRPRKSDRRPSRSQRGFRLVAESLESRHLLATISWIGGAFGSWSDSANWDTGRLPNSNDDVIIPDASEVSIAASGQTARKVTGGQISVKPGGALQLFAGGSLQRLDVDGGSIHFGYFDTMTIANRLEWSGGTIGSTIPVILSGTGMIDGADDKFLSARIQVSNTIVVSGSGPLFVNGGATGFDIPANGVLTLTDSAQLRVSDNAYGSRIQVAGTLRKSGAGESIIDTRSMMQFTIVGGTIDVQAGTLQVLRPSANFEGGMFHVDQGATLRMSELANNWSGRFEGSGGGRFEFASGNLYTIGSGAEFAFPQGFFHWTGGAFNATASSPLRNTGWIRISGDGASVLGPYAMINDGVIRLGENTFWSARELNNTTSGVLELEDGAVINDGTITNSGKIMKVGGSGTATFRLYNQITNLGGTIGATAGKLVLDNSLRITDAIFAVAPGASVESTRDFGFSGSLTGSGGGQLDIRGGSFSAQAANSVNFPEGMLRIFGGYLAGDTAPIRNVGFLELAGANVGFTFRAFIENSGTVIQNFTGNSTINGFAVIRNLAGALWEIRDTGFIQYVDFFNAGTIRGNSQDRTATFGSRLTNQPGGTIEVVSGTLALNAGGEYAPMTMHVVAGAELRFSGPQIHYFATGTFSSTGTGTIRSIGTPLFSATDALPVFDFADGLLLLDDGTQLWDGITFAGYTQVVADTQIFMRSSDVRPIRNTGVFRHTGSGNFLINVIGSFHNQGLYELTSDADFRISGVQTGSNPVGIINTGVFRKSGGSGTSALIDPDSVAIARFDNQGTVEVASGTLSLGERINQLTREGSGTNARNVLTGGIWKIGGSGVLELPGGNNFAPTATLPPIAVNRADVTISDPLASFPQFRIDTNSGTFALAGGRDLLTAGGLNNTGTLRVGPGSTLTVNGPLNSSGTMAFGIAGSPASGQFGAITATGTATFAGVAAVELAQGFAPTVGSIYTLATFASRTGDFGSVTGIDPYFAKGISDTTFGLNTVNGGNAIDLKAGSLTLPGSVNIGQVLNVGYTVANLTDGTWAGTWKDSIYLSLDTTLDASDVLLVRIDRTGVDALTSYSQTASGAVPVIPAGQYFALLVADSRLVLGDTDRVNNISVSSTRVNVGTPVLNFGTPESFGLDGGKSAVYRLDVPPGGGDVILDASFAGSLQGEVFVRYGTPPTSSDFDFASANVLEPDRKITLLSPQAGAWYVLVYGRDVAGTNSDVTLKATRQPLGINAVVPSGGSNLGTVSGVLRGSGLTSDTVVTLRNASGSVVATSRSTFIDRNTLNVQFDLTGVPVGVYDIQAQTPAGIASLDDGFSVTQAAVGRLVATVTTPGVIRAGRTYTARIEYQNVGNTDLVAPLLMLTATNAKVRLPSSLYNDGEELMLLATNPNGPANVLSPGARGFIEVEFVPSSDARLRLLTLDDPTAPVDWNVLKAAFKPPGVSDDGWDATFANFVSEVGTTWGQFQQRVAGVAAGRGGAGSISDVATLVNEILNAADGFGSVSSRNADSAVGLGLPDLMDVSISVDNSGDATIKVGDRMRSFIRLASGEYIGRPGETAQLTRVGGLFSLRQDGGLTWNFNADGKLASVRDPNGNVDTYEYTSGRVSRIVTSNGDAYTYEYGPQGRLSRVTDPLGRNRTYSHDALGRLVTMTDSSSTIRISYVSDSGPSANAIASIIDDSGLIGSFQYDSRGRIVNIDNGGTGGTALNYASGRVTMSSAGRSVNVSVDDQGRIRNFADASGATLSATADDSDGSVSTVDSMGYRWEYVYDDFGNPVSMRDPLGNTMSAVYDPGTTTNRIRRFTDQRGNSVSYDYDAAGNLSRITYPDGTTRTLEYDDVGRVTSVTNRRGETTSYTYDSKGELISFTRPGGVTESLVRDSARRIASISTSVGKASFAYDAAGRLTSYTDALGRSVQYSFDAQGRFTGMTAPDGLNVAYSYDAENRLISIADGNGKLITGYGYDISGRLVSETRGNGTTTSFSYDVAGMVASIVNREPDNTVISRSDYTYDANGVVTSLTTLDGVTTFTTDPLGQIVRADLPGGRTIEYTYDAAGNRVVVSDSGTDTVYAVNSLNQYTSAGAATFTYDADGNLASRTDATGTTTYAYDETNRLISIVKPSLTITLTYDANGRVLRSTRNGVATEYLYTPDGQLLAEYGPGGLIAQYIQGEGPVARIAAGSTAYYHYNRTGDVTELTGTGGAVLNRYRYLPFGEVLSSTEAVANPFTFVGGAGVVSDIDGLYLMGNRHYDPETGRFTSPDPVGIEAGEANFYRYAGNNPAVLIDPDGLSGFGMPNIFPGVKGFDVVEFARRGAGEVVNGIEQTIAATRPYLEQVARAGLRNGSAAVEPLTERLALYGMESLERQIASLESNIKNFEKLAPEMADKIRIAGDRARRVLEDARPVLERIRQGNAAAAKLAERGVEQKVIEAAAKKTVETTVKNEIAEQATVKVGGQIVKQGGRRLAARAIPVIGNLFMAWELGSFVGWLARQTPGVDEYWTEWLTPLADATYWTDSRDEVLGDRAWELFRNGWQPKSEALARLLASSDPNDITGPGGFGPERHITESQSLPYRIRFENLPTATAAAQEVFIDLPLDPDLDWASFELGDFGFSGNTYEVPAGLRSYSTRIDLTSSLGFYVDVDAEVNLGTGLARWTFRSIDPLTNDLIADATKGFLPANLISPKGEGFVDFLIRQDAGLSSGTTINAQARIVFDLNAPIDTNVWGNTIDVTPPVSTVSALPSSSESQFLVSWSGSDNSGIVSYDVFVSTDGGAFVALVTGTTTTSILFDGIPGKTYAFYSIATDGLFLREQHRGTADTTTTVRPSSQSWTVLHDGVLVDEGESTSLGIVPAGKPGPIRSFEIRNDGSDLLVTRDPILPNGVIMIEKPGSIAPGESGWLKVAILSPANEISGRIEIQTEDPAVTIRIDVTGRAVEGPFVVARDVVILRPRSRYVGGSKVSSPFGASPSQIAVRFALENLGDAKWRGIIGFRAIFENLDGTGSPIVIDSQSFARRISLRPGSMTNLRLKFRIPEPTADGLYRLIIVPAGDSVPDAGTSTATSQQPVRIERPRMHAEVVVPNNVPLVPGKSVRLVSEIRNQGNLFWHGPIRFDLVAVRSSDSRDMFTLAEGIALRTSIAVGKSRLAKFRIKVPDRLPDWIVEGEYQFETLPHG